MVGVCEGWERWSAGWERGEGRRGEDKGERPHRDVAGDDEEAADPDVHLGGLGAAG